MQILEFQMRLIYLPLKEGERKFFLKIFSYDFNKVSEAELIYKKRYDYDCRRTDMR